MTGTQNEFHIKNTNDWKSIHQYIFGNVVPNHCKWTDIDDIVKILNIIGKVRHSNNTFLPLGGYLVLNGAQRSFEDGCIELIFSIPYIIKPGALYFESFGNDLEWNYFRLESENLNPSGVIPTSPDSHEEIIFELEPLHYVEKSHWDEMDYEENSLLSTRQIARYFKGGSFAIFKKTSKYNDLGEAYNGQHSKINVAQFRQYIETANKSY